MTTPKCRHCGKPLRAQTDTDWNAYDAVLRDGGRLGERRDLRRFTTPNGTYGYNGDGKFCTLRCGYAWAVKRA